MTGDPVEATGLHVEDGGNPNGPPTAFIHGFMSSNLQWEPNRQRLGAHLRTLLVEQPGHGGSPGPDDPAAYRADAVLDQIDRIRSDRGIERWWMVGQSLGGAIAIRYALRHPERVRGLVFTNSRAVFGLAGKRRPAGEVTGTADTDDTSKASDDDLLSAREWTPERVKGLPYHPGNAKRLPPELKAKMAVVADAMPLPVFKYLRTGGPWDSVDELHQLSIPVLLVNGRYEKAFQPCVAQARSSIADLRIVHLEGGHSVNIDQPEDFDRAVLDFITP